MYVRSCFLILYFYRDLWIVVCVFFLLFFVVVFIVWCMVSCFYLWTYDNFLGLYHVSFKQISLSLQILSYHWDLIWKVWDHGIWSFTLQEMVCSTYHQMDQRLLGSVGRDCMTCLQGKQEDKKRRWEHDRNQRGVECKRKVWDENKERPLCNWSTSKVLVRL